MSDFLKPLESIQKAETPSFLLTRIHQRIKNKYSCYVSFKVIWAVGCTFGLLIFFNFLVMTHVQGDLSAIHSEIDIQLDLLPDNLLYQWKK